MNFTRRAVLVGGGGLVVLGALMLSRSPDDEALDADLRERIAPLGKAYRDAEGLDVAQARAHLEARLGSVPEQRAALQTALAQAVAADFASGDVVAVDGWHLARTEALIAASA